MEVSDAQSNRNGIYLRALREGHAAWLQSNPDGTPTSRVAFLSDYVFSFTTYDEEMAELFASKALEVCAAISNRTTFDYIKDADQYRWFLLMCNMPFFSRRLNWGTSIRGAWWDTSTPNDAQLDTTALWLDGQQITEPIRFTTDEWREFIAAIIAFANGD